jgi:uncharacterized protein (DUF488 family)
LSLRIYTIGHSTRTADEFLSLLQEFGILRLVDVRQYPGSRRLPQFNRESLEQQLAQAGVAYAWLRSLGGRRPAGSTPSPNTGLRNAGFRNYADYMLTPEFRAGIEQLLAGAEQAPSAVMCAEAVYWRCHRRLVSDYLVACGHDVQHIMGPGQLRPHDLTAGAVVRDGGVTYPEHKDSPHEPTLFEIRPTD